MILPLIGNNICIGIDNELYVVVKLDAQNYIDVIINVLEKCCSSLQSVIVQ